MMYIFVLILKNKDSYYCPFGVPQSQKNSRFCPSIARFMIGVLEAKDLASE